MNTKKKNLAIWSVALIAIPLVQLSLNMLLTEGAYLVSKLKIEYKNLTLQEQIINDSIAEFQNPYNLSSRAKELGMIHSDEPVRFLYLED